MRKFCALFDCDGVLVDSEPALAGIGARILQARGIPAKAEDFAAFIGTGEDRYIGGVMEKYGFRYSTDVKDELYARYLQEAGDYLQARPGAKAFIFTLKGRGVPIALASSADAVKVNKNLACLGLSSSDFDVCISGSDIQRKKPFPDIYLLAAERLGASPSDCVVFEDAESGVLAAKAAGMIAIGISSSLPEAVLREAGADRILPDLSEAAKCLDSLDLAW